MTVFHQIEKNVVMTAFQQIKKSLEIWWNTVVKNTFQNRHVAKQATQESRDKFIYNTPNLDQRAGAKRQTVIKPITGIEWMSRQIVEEVVKREGELAEWWNEMASWGEWEEEKEPQPRRSRREEEWLWKRLEESDRKQAQEEKYAALKKSKKVSKARERMKAGKEQTSIREKMVEIRHRRVHPV